MLKRLLLTIAWLALGTSAAHADGIFQQLPKDGAWARYQVQFLQGDVATRTVEITIKSVGRVEENNKPHRWIELKTPLEDSTQVVKLLVPEEHLGHGKAPLEHVLRAWRKQGEQGAQSLADARRFWLLLFLSGPMQNVEKLDPAIVTSKLGELQCQGISGKIDVTEDEGYALALQYSVRRHKKSPFGTVSATIDCRVSKDGKRLNESRFAVKLLDFGTDAQSELAGYQ